jgi:hypothetical protein
MRTCPRFVAGGCGGGNTGAARSDHCVEGTSQRDRQRAEPGKDPIAGHRASVVVAAIACTWFDDRIDMQRLRQTIIKLSVWASRAAESCKVRRRTRYLAGIALLVLSAAPTMAQTLFQPGQAIVGNTGDMDTACVSQEALERYSSAKETCLDGDPDDCRATKDLEQKGLCGAHHDSYTVLSIDNQSGVLKVSPASDASTVYWADPRDFKPAE